MIAYTDQYAYRISQQYLDPISMHCIYYLRFYTDLFSSMHVIVQIAIATRDELFYASCTF